MISLALALLKSFTRDRGTLLLAFLAPLAFSALFGSFYVHLDSPNGTRFDVALVTTEPASPHAKDLSAAILKRAAGRVHISLATHDPVHCDAVIIVPHELDGATSPVIIESRFPLPGLNDALRMLVQAANADLVSTSSNIKAPSIEIEDQTKHGIMLRQNAAGIPVLFVLFALSSLVGRGLTEDALGLRDRLASAGLNRRRQELASVLALTTIAWVQIAVTLGLLVVVFGVQPASLFGLLLTTTFTASASAAFISLLAVLCGSRARFAAVAPVVVLLLSGLAGSMVPIEILPDVLAQPSRWLFTRWSIEACAGAINGGEFLASVGLLCAWTLGCLAVLLVIVDARRPWSPQTVGGAH